MAFTATYLVQVCFLTLGHGISQGETCFGGHCVGVLLFVFACVIVGVRVSLRTDCPNLASDCPAVGSNCFHTRSSHPTVRPSCFAVRACWLWCRPERHCRLKLLASNVQSFLHECLRRRCVALCEPLMCTVRTPVSTHASSQRFFDSQAASHIIHTVPPPPNKLLLYCASGMTQFACVCKHTSCLFRQSRTLTFS